MENLTFQDFCTAELLAMPRTYYHCFPADELLRMHLDSYDSYLQHRGEAEVSRLEEFRNRREQLTRGAPLPVFSQRTHRGVVGGSWDHFRAFLEACRRDGQTLEMDDPDFDEAAFYVWASGLDSEVPQWMQTSFSRSLHFHAEEIRREMYGQPRRLTNLGPGLPPYVYPGAPTPHPIAIRSQLYQLLDESENYHWMFGNPVLGLLRPILLDLVQHIARGTVPFEEEAVFWAGRVRMAGELMEEVIEMRLREPMLNHPVNFDDEPQRQPVMETLIRRYQIQRLMAGFEYLESISRDSSEWTLMEIIEPDENFESEISDALDNDTDSESSDGDSLDGDTLDGYGTWIPPPYADFEPSQQEIRDDLWVVAAQENIPEVLRAVLIDMADQSDSEDEDSHVRARRDWFDRGNILEDRRPMQLGPARHPWEDSDSDDEMDDGLHWRPSYFDQDNDGDMSD